jgi:hypothetical protein
LLYDDVSAPFQTCNLVNEPSTRQTLHRLDELTQAWLTMTDDDFAPASAIADRFIGPGHRDNYVPTPPLEPVIRQGQVSPL